MLRGDAGGVHVVAVDAARNVEVADGGSLQADERGAGVVRVGHTLRSALTPVVGQRVVGAAEGAAEGS